MKISKKISVIFRIGTDTNTERPANGALRRLPEV